MLSKKEEMHTISIEYYPTIDEDIEEEIKKISKIDSLDVILFIALMLTATFMFLVMARAIP